MNPDTLTAADESAGPVVSAASGQLKPVRCLTTQGMVTAAHLEIVSNYDNLRDLVRFGYVICDDSNRPLVSGEVELRGDTDYQSWDATREGAYRIVAQRLQLELNLA